MTQGRYIPALSFGFLTDWYDPVVRWTTREKTFRQALLEQMDPRSGESILDVGCGTGTFLNDAAAATQHVDLAGIDADERVLGIARAKAVSRGARVRFVQAFADKLPFGNDSFTKVCCSLFLHHLERPAKMRALQEMLRVLRPGGSLHIADWGRPSDALMKAAFLSVRLLDGFAPTREHAAGALPSLVGEAGFTSVETTRSFSTPCGTITLLRADKPPRDQTV